MPTNLHVRFTSGTVLVLRGEGSFESYVEALEQARREGVFVRLSADSGAINPEHVESVSVKP